MVGPAQRRRVGPRPAHRRGERWRWRRRALRVGGPAPAVIPRRTLGHMVIDSTVAVLVITPRQAILVRLAIRADTMTRMVATLRRPLAATYAAASTCRARVMTSSVAANIYTELLAPLRAHWATPIIVIARTARSTTCRLIALGQRVPSSRHGPLRYAMRLHDRVVPSVQSWPREIGEPSRPIRGVVIERDVPGGADEVAAIRGAWKSGRVATLTGAAATESRHGGALDLAIIHLAGSRHCRRRDPMASPPHTRCGLRGRRTVAHDGSLQRTCMPASWS